MKPVTPKSKSEVHTEPAQLLASLKDADAPAVIRTLDELEAVARQGAELPLQTLEILLPYLGHSGARAATARILALLGSREAVDPIRSALAHTDVLEVRLALLASLADLGQSNFAIRTLRSMLLHGDPAVSPRIVDTIEKVAKEDDAKAIARLIRVAPAPMQLRLACIAYRLGEISTYRIIVESTSLLNASSPADEVERALRSIASIGSQRFASHMLEYASRETRPWFLARSRSIANTLATHGRPEKSPEELFGDAKSRRKGVC